jgi:hypothetical protein
VATQIVHGRTAAAEEPTYVTELADLLRVIVVAGVITGVLVAGVGGRLAMLLLRLTSPDTVVGVESDDGFTIGEFTLGGSYNLLNLGGAVGVIGAAAYVLVSPWLLGPLWFRRFTVAAVGGALAGAVVIPAGGIDFNVLGPLWLAVTLFVGLPFLFGWLIGPVVDAVDGPGSWTRRGRLRWALPVVLVLAVPLVVLPGAVMAIVVAALLPLRRELLGVLTSGVGGMVVRAVFLGIALLSFVALAGDLSDLDLI